MKKVDFEHYADIFKALGHPVRLQMVCGLCETECNVNKIVDRLGLPQSTVSQQLGILRDKGIISARKDGVRTCYRVVDKDVQKIAALLKR